MEAGQYWPHVAPKVTCLLRGLANPTITWLENALFLHDYKTE